MIATQFSIVIPTFNGLARLQQNLPAVLVCAKLSGLVYEIIIVDDGSTDKSTDWLSANHPEIRVLANSSNLGFIETANRGVKYSNSEIVVLLNNDVRPDPECLQNIESSFRNKDVFAITFKALFPDNRQFREGAKLLRNRFGFYTVLHAERHQPVPLPDGRIPSIYPVGGHCAVRRSMFHKLGGFDSLYAPFYWEDADLGYRAWNAGWKTIYDPSRVVVHDHIGTIKSIFGERKAAETRYRNRLLFHWKHLRGLQRVVHFIFLFLRIPIMLISRRMSIYVLSSALKRWKEYHAVG